jgi:hypothetical protein
MRNQCFSNALDIGNKNNGLRYSLETFDVSMQVMRRTISEGLKQACDRYHPSGLILRAEKSDRQRIVNSIHFKMPVGVDLCVYPVQCDLSQPFFLR